MRNVSCFIKNGQLELTALMIVQVLSTRVLDIFSGKIFQECIAIIHLVVNMNVSQMYDFRCSTCHWQSILPQHCITLGTED